MQDHKQVFSGSPFEGMAVKNILENNEIEVFEINSTMASIEPWAVTAGGFNPFILKVSAEDFEKATKIVEAYYNGEYSLDE